MKLVPYHTPLRPSTMRSPKKWDLLSDEPGKVTFRTQNTVGKYAGYFFDLEIDTSGGGKIPTITRSSDLESGTVKAPHREADPRKFEQGPTRHSQDSHIMAGVPATTRIKKV